MDNGRILGTLSAVDCGISERMKLVFEVNHVTKKHLITRRAFDVEMRVHPLLLVPDSADEVRATPVKRPVAEMKEARCRAASEQCIISSRAILPNPAQDLSFVELTPLGADEVGEIRQRLRMAP